MARASAIHIRNMKRTGGASRLRQDGNEHWHESLAVGREGLSVDREGCSYLKCLTNTLRLMMARRGRFCIIMGSTTDVFLSFFYDNKGRAAREGGLVSVTSRYT